MKNWKNPFFLKRKNLLGFIPKIKIVFIIVLALETSGVA